MLQVLWLYGHIIGIRNNHVGSDPKEYDQIQQNRITVYIHIFIYTNYAIIYI